MKRATVWMFGFAVAGPLLVGCSPTVTQNVAESDTAVAMAEYEIGEPLTHGNLTIFPVVSKQPLTEDRFITLDEGLKAGTIEVFEVGSENGEGVPSDAYPNAQPNLPNLPNTNDSPDPFDAAPEAPTEEASEGCEEDVAGQDEEQPDVQIDEPQVQNDEPQQLLIDDIEFQQGSFQGGGREVNRLMVVNKSDRPLYLMPGEIIIGGSQDRTIGQELVIAPTGKPVPVDVFCVEHERWNDRDVDDTVEQLVLASRGILGESVSIEGRANFEAAAMEINKGKFTCSIGHLNKSARLALQHTGDQGKVWNEVAIQNASSKVAASDATFTANYSDAEFVTQLEPFIKELQQPIADHDNIVGVIVAVNGKVESMDMFESTPLFKKLWPKLLKSYALDAATQAGETTPAVLTIADAKSFFEKAARGEVTKEDTNGDLAVVARETSGVICFTSRKIDTAAEAAMPAEGLSDAAEFSEFGGVHTSAFAH